MPAHSSVATSVWDGMLAGRASSAAAGRSTRPPTASRQVGRVEGRGSRSGSARRTGRWASRRRRSERRIDVSQFSGWLGGRRVDVVGSGVGVAPSRRPNTGRPAAAHAHIPPARLTASNPQARSDSVTAADRPPDRHTTTIRRSPGSSRLTFPDLAHRHQRRPRGHARPATRRAPARRGGAAPASTRASPARAPTWGVGAEACACARPSRSAARHPPRRRSRRGDRRRRRSPRRAQHAGGDLGAVAAGAVHDHRRWPGRARRASRSSTASGISRAPGRVPPAVSPGPRTSTSWSAGSSPRSSASCSIVSRELVSMSSGRAANDPAGVVELPDDPVVTDAASRTLASSGDRRIADEDDVAVGWQHVAGPLGEAALEPDVDRAPQVAGGEVGRFAGVEQHAPRGRWRASTSSTVEQRRRRPRRAAACSSRLRRASNSK